MASQSGHEPTPRSVDQSLTPIRSIALPAPVAPVHRGWRKRPLGRRSQLARYTIAGFLAAVALRLVMLGRTMLFGAGRPPESRSLQSRAVDAEPTAGESVATPVWETAADWSIIVLAVLAAAAFVFWLHRVCSNWTTQGKPRYSAEWAALAWIVPPLNLWRPVLMMIDLFAERPGMRRIDRADRNLIALWWSSGLAGLLGRVYLWIRPDAKVPSGGRSTDYAGLAVYGLLAVSALAAMRLVSELTSRHDLRSR